MKDIKEGKYKVRILEITEIIEIKEEIIIPGLIIKEELENQDHLQVHTHLIHLIQAHLILDHLRSHLEIAPNTLPYYHLRKPLLFEKIKELNRQELNT
jgi:hypothetical protein